MHTQFGRYWRLLVTYLKPQWLRVILLSILLMGNIALQLINPQVIRYFIDSTQANGPLSALLIAAGLFLAIAFLQRAVAFSSIYSAENVGWTATNAMRADLALHCLRLDMSFHKTHTPGELIERIDSDVTTLANFFSQFIIQVLGNALLIGGVLLLLWREDWRVGLALTLFSILTFVTLRLLQNIAVKQWAGEREANAGFYSFLEEHLTGTEDIRAAGAERYVTRLMFSLMRRLLETYRRARLVSNLTFFSTNFLYIVGYTLGLAIGAYLYLQHQITIGTAYVFVYYIGMLSTPLQTIKEQVEDLQKASASIERVEELFAMRSGLEDQALTTLPGDALAVAFRAVTFSYDGQENVLQDISFELQPGKVLGLLGRTGSGKTTMARLLFRLYDPASGEIYLDGKELRDVALEDLRNHIGMVTQDVQLFHASIRDNLTFFNRSISDERIEQALKELDLWQWLQVLPQGLDMLLGADGHGLSAGEAQLLAFARVFLKHPGLVILDEASSRLDPLTERLLERAVDRLLADRTGVVIAHSLQTVQRADDIMILEHGRVVEYGPRTALASDPRSRFYRLLQTGLEEVLA
ncbi:MAG TPA: ABC transporter ATP-binding protein [Ktedonobacteraceae bacterium]|nr:ABC transporter ATP-binding protein [Ktedonobacteraceae bacterium]